MIYRLFLAAAAGAVLCATPCAAETPSQAQRQQLDVQRAIAADVGQIAKSSVDREVRASQPDPLNAPCPPGTDSRTSDLCAQWKAADAAADAAWWTKLAGALSALSFAGVAAALFLSHRANRIARDSMEAQLRAWIAIDMNDADGFRKRGDETQFVFIATFENVGATPAIHYRIFGALAFGSAVRSEIDDTIKKFTDGTMSWVDTNLFPHRPHRRHISCDHKTIPEEPSEVHLYVVAAYQTAFSKTQRFTAVTYRIQDRRRDDGLVDLHAPPRGDNLYVRSPDDFVGCTT